MTLGIIDVGTNSIHLLVGILGLNGRFHVMLKERDLTRLGEGGLASGHLTRASLGRAMEVLKRFASILKRCGVDHVEAVATSAVREAANGRMFVRQVRSRLGIPLRIISGTEEGRLIYLGVVQAHHLKRPSLVITIGGGSAQVIHGAGARLRHVKSVQLGGARLAQMFIRHDPPHLQEVEAMRRHAAQVWRRIRRSPADHKWGQALASSATIAQVMMATHILAYGRPPKNKKRIAVSRAALETLVGWLAQSLAQARVKLPGLDPRREDLALPTVVVLLEWMRAYRVSRLRYAPGSLREGLVMDYLIRHRLGKVKPVEHPLEDLWASGDDATLWMTGEKS